ncbi:MAG TPA: HEAT repeat domain-containing protein [Vicinamibacterales bacterium]
MQTHTLMFTLVFGTVLTAAPAFAQPPESTRFQLEAKTHSMRFAAGFADQDRKLAEAERAEAAKARQRAREDRVYDAAMRHIYDSEWERAIERFNEVLAQKGSRTDAALYWKAYAQDRQGLRADALTTIGTLTRDHPNSRYIKQAQALEAEVRRNAGQPVRPQDQADEDLKLMAIAALQHSAPDQAVPMLEKLLTGNATPKLKERALFVLAQSNSPQARNVLVGIARGNATPELQSRAIMYLGMHGGQQARNTLVEVYGSTTDVDAKKQIIRALGMGGERTRVLEAARSEQNPELRAEAVRQLGMHGGHEELAQLYAKESDPQIKRQIIAAMAMGGNTARLTGIAKSEPDPELRRAAIRSLGMHGSASSSTLVELYAAEKDPTIKRAVISALGMQGDAAALVAIARKENDPALKREIVARLTHLPKSKVATDYLLEIINK